MKKGLIVTIILVVAPIVWLIISLNTINSTETKVSGDYKDIENSINTVANEYVQNANENEVSTTPVSGESTGPKYGTPISKLIEGAKISVATANVYSDPNDTELPVGTLYKDTVVTVQDYPDGWSQVKSDNIAGWTKTENVSKPDDGSNNSLGYEEKSNIGKTATITVSNTLNVRRTADGEVIDAIAGGTEVKIIGANADESWYQIQWGTNTGWITSNPDYVKIKE